MPPTTGAPRRRCSGSQGDVCGVDCRTPIAPVGPGPRWFGSGRHCRSGQSVSGPEQYTQSSSHVGAPSRASRDGRVAIMVIKEVIPGRRAPRPTDACGVLQVGFPFPSVNCTRHTRIPGPFSSDASCPDPCPTCATRSIAPVTADPPDEPSASDADAASDRQVQRRPTARYPARPASPRMSASSRPGRTRRSGGPARRSAVRWAGARWSDGHRC